MAANTLASEHRWEAKTFWNLLLVDEAVGTFRLTNNEFPDLRLLSEQV